MQTPIKITPDRIRDAIIQVFFSTDIPFEPLVGYVHQVLDPIGFSYMNRPPTQNFPAFGLDGSFELQLGPQHYFFNDEVKVRLDSAPALTFNCIGKYIGWEAYSSFIQKVLDGLSQQKIIHDFPRIGVRYINDFENMDVQNELSMSFVLGTDTPQDYRIAHFRTMWEESGEYLINVNMGTERLTGTNVTRDGTVLEKKSIIDIDVIRHLTHLSTVEKVMEAIGQAHQREKEIFYGLMKPEFLVSLNPEYE